MEKANQSNNIEKSEKKKAWQVVRLLLLWIFMPLTAFMKLENTMREGEENLNDNNENEQKPSAGDSV